MAFNVRTVDVIGVRPYSFKGRNGEDVIMNQVYFTFPDKRTEGLASGVFAISEPKAIENLIVVGSTVRVCYAEKRWQYVGTI